MRGWGNNVKSDIAHTTSAVAEQIGCASVRLFGALYFICSRLLARISLAFNFLGIFIRTCTYFPGSLCCRFYDQAIFAWLLRVLNSHSKPWYDNTCWHVCHLLRCHSICLKLIHLRRCVFQNRHRVPFSDAVCFFCSLFGPFFPPESRQTSPTPNRRRNRANDDEREKMVRLILWTHVGPAKKETAVTDM